MVLMPVPYILQKPDKTSFLMTCTAAIDTPKTEH
jgi:hypothetical protein